MTDFRNIRTGEVVSCAGQAAARFFDNRSPIDWQTVGGPEPRWDAREIARSALGELPEAKRAAFLGDLLCELRGEEARSALAVVRSRITSHLHDLIVAEYDAELAASDAAGSAQMARAR